MVPSYHLFIQAEQIIWIHIAKPHATKAWSELIRYLERKLKLDPLGQTEINYKPGCHQTCN